MAAGAALWWLDRPAGTGGTAATPPTAPPTISGAALYASSFRDAEGRMQPLGRFQGRPLVLNFWATWCAPCREEMPGFAELDRRWQGRVAFVGLSSEDPETVARFGRDLKIGYALWTGGSEVDALASRLGNVAAVLPFTALVDPSGRVVETKVGPYSTAELQRKLETISGKER
jgi:thiol-disulfide isomerase/thioredoxin